MKAFKITLLLFLIVLILALGLMTYLHLTGQTLPFLKPAPPQVEPLPKLALRPETESEQQLAKAYAQVWSYTLEGDCVSDGETARQQLSLTVLDTDAFAGTGMREDLTAFLAARVDQAKTSEEIYGEDGQFLPSLLEEGYAHVLAERAEHAEDYVTQQIVTLCYRYTENGWELENGEELYPFLPDAQALYIAATGDLPYLPLHYRIPEDALCGPAPDETKFLVTDDPMEVMALLERPEAKALIGEETLVFRPDLPFIPDTLIHCYLDESILCIVWQEEEAREVGTFGEVFIADGSQFRRKISSDEPWSLWFERTSTFAKEANAVLAVGGDFYYHGRNCGVSVYQREIIRFRPDNADTCFITADGDMLFLYQGDGASQEEVEQFMRENDVVFSLAFGPVLIDDGVDVTPENYPWGEINDFYARSALGLLGRHHYLTMNLNCGKGEYDHLPSLRDAADAMVERGCYKAYTLDGGQTASTAFHGELINPVQYGREKEISDIIYFATAVPNGD